MQRFLVETLDSQGRVGIRAWFETAADALDVAERWANLGLNVVCHLVS